MPKKTFLEEELAREARIRKEPIESKLSALLHKARKIISPSQESVGNMTNIYTRIATDLAASKYGLVLTPNETRELYGYPTISDEPQRAGIVKMTKLQSTDGDEIEVPLYFYD